MPYWQMDMIRDLKGSGPFTIGTITLVVMWEKLMNLHCVKLAGKVYDLRLSSGESRIVILDNYWTEIVC